MFRHVSEKGIRNLKDLQFLKEESDYKEVGLTRFEKHKLKDVIASLYTSVQDKCEFIVCDSQVTSV